MVHQYFDSRSAWAEAICSEKMPSSPEQIEVINVVDPFKTEGFSEPCVSSWESAEPVDHPVDFWQWSTSKKLGFQFFQTIIQFNEIQL